MATLTLEKQKEIDNEINELLLKTNASYPQDSLLDITKRLGIDVYISDFGDDADQVSGVIKYPEEDEKPQIHLNKTHAKERQTFTLAHELGHYILHPHEEKLRVDRYDYTKDTPEAMEETEANYFAASLLVPKEDLIRLLNVTDDLSIIAKYFGVSEAVIRNRTRWLKTNHQQNV